MSRRTRIRVWDLRFRHLKVRVLRRFAEDSIAALCVCVCACGFVSVWLQGFADEAPNPKPQILIPDLKSQTP